MNPLANMFNRGQQAPVQNNRFDNAMNMMQQFNQFRSNFQGDPKQAVMNLLSSGQMSQQQFEQLSQMAKTFQNGIR